MTRISLPLVIGCVIAAGGCASSQTDRHAAPYALLIPGGETAPDPLPRDTRLIETERRPTDDALQSPETRLARARRLYRDLAFEASLEELRRAQVELEAELRRIESYDLLDRLFLLRGLGELALGRPEQAEASLRQATFLRSDRASLDPAEFAPDVRTAYARARDPLRTEAPFALSIETTPTGARLVVDGASHATTPASVRLHSGRHYLMLQALGYATETRIVDVSGESAPSLRVELTPLDDFRLAGELAELDTDEFAELDDALRLRLVPLADGASPVHIGRTGTGWGAALLDTRSGEIQDTRFSNAASLDRALPELVESLRDTPQKKPLVRQWWLWTVVGVVVVGTTLGLYFGLREQPETQLVIAQP